MSKLINLDGQIFGRLTVVRRVASTPYGKAKYLCKCECGNEHETFAQCLRRGHTKSCGCLRVDLPKQTFRTHGRSKTAEFRIWCHIKTRCTNVNNPAYPAYGGRGITVCKSWSDSFETFFTDMGARPSEKHSLDRINNDGPYSPENCRWATQGIQASNRRGVVVIEFNGISDTLAGWSRRSGVPYLKLRRRIVDGWDVGRALEAKDASVRASL